MDRRFGVAADFSHYRPVFFAAKEYPQTWSRGKRKLERVV
jgi:hypothetical protein